MKCYYVYLIRHGMTEANIKGQYAGVLDIPVCPEGREKLENLKKNYEYPDAQEFYSSPLIRCRQTAEILYPDKNIIINEKLREQNFGDWEGKTTQELSDDENFKKWIANSCENKTPNGESLQEFRDRLFSGFEEIINSVITRGITKICIFTHGGVIMNLMSMYSMSSKNIFDWMAENGCGYKLKITPSFWMRDKKLEVIDKIPIGSDLNISGNFKDLIENLK